jgi:flagellar biosynthetic protein FliR
VATDVASLLRAAVGELLVGSVIGMTVRVTLAAADIAGSIVGQSIGLGFAGTVDPTQNDTVLPTTHLLGSFAMLIFLAFGGHHALLGALAASFTTAPIGHGLEAAAYGSIVSLGSVMMARGLQIAAPVVATMFIVQLGTAFVARAAPRVNLFSFAFAVAIGAGMLVLWVAAPSLATTIDVQLRHLPEALSLVVGAP